MASAIEELTDSEKPGRTLSKELGACSEEGTRVEISPDQHALDHTEIRGHANHLTISQVCL